ncbi:ParB N-terminal domain-containing protein [Amaricoccus solimangrovi]|uniref:Chromosome partitioning protein ParB n=1 Tax=Amaricoccus solimangrovi TaxID=2589815 RepID=A0A501WS07_9RHOB|nr:ParB N-terminal domain-containing protein [Amaricoccus solimangrovi]TPE51622.1 chromosome partitioning protein ParB [Amaricoccus solimangrovi]
MARRKRVEGPSPEELIALEQGFATKPASNPFAVPPIAQVAAEAAAAADPLPSEARVEAARDRADAEALRAAEAEGRVIARVRVSEIVVDELTRDRMALDREELDELKISIRSNGLRLPVELFELATPKAGQGYGLISGLRRVTAMRELYGPDATIAALIREPADAAEAVAAMVEENEIRAGLSHYERGRVAALAVGQGRFADLDEAVARLFASASKAKRSKIRSFALVHEELGDMLSFPQALTEKAGLRLANALRLGFEERLRAALAEGRGVDAASEWEAIARVIEEADAGSRLAARGGRPRKRAAASGGGQGPREGRELANGVVIRHERDDAGHLIRFEGAGADADLVERAMQRIIDLFGPAP